MSNLAPSYAAPKPRPGAPGTERRRLRAVSAQALRRARPRPIYAVITVATLMLIVVAQLLLSIMVSQGAYQISTVESTSKDLQRSYQAVSEDLDRVASPQNLAANAEALGMVINSTPVYLRLSDGAVLGSPSAAAADAGTVTAGAGNLVPNSLLAGVPLVTAPKVSPATTPQTPAESDPASASAAVGSPAPVPLDGALPAPTTH
ncbi:MAG: hypothetical protein ABI255_11745 [Microbacteriaceae bacterium]